MELVGLVGVGGDVNVPWFCAHALMLTHLEQNPERTLRKLESNLLKRLRGQAKWVVSDSHHQNKSHIQSYSHWWLQSMGCEFKARKLNHCAVSHKMDFGENTHRTTEPYKTCGFGTLGREVARKSQGNETSVENTSAESCSASIWTCGMNPGQICKSTKWKRKKHAAGWNNSGKSLFQSVAFYNIVAGPPIVHLSSKHCKGGTIHSRFVSKLLKMHGTVPGPWPCCNVMSFGWISTHVPSSCAQERIGFRRRRHSGCVSL